jgi:UDP-N-acetylmuramoyl-tripeptide--D-alanyl-D-alanine ligase
VAARLSTAGQRSGRRMEVTTRPDGVTVVNDSYNASPESTASALHSLAVMTRRGRRAWAVLGMMSELGEASDAAHEQIGRLASELGVERLLVVGEQARPILAGAEGRTKRAASCSPDVEAAVAVLRSEARPGDVILVKASKSFALWRIAEALIGDDTHPRRTG